MTNFASLLSTQDPTPRYQQICDGLREQITQGQLCAGKKLPASRALSQDLGIARSTVVTAYDQLVAEGYLESRPGAGIFVCDVAPITSPTAQSRPHTVAAFTPEKGMLTPGEPDQGIFPTQPWARCVARVARNTPKALIQLDDPFGDPELRREIAAYAGRWRGITATADQVIVTAGASAGLELAMELLGEGGPLALEAPGYIPTQRFATTRGWGVQWLPVSAHGAQLPAEPSKLTVLTPSHQFPLGGTLPVSIRQAFLTTAEQAGGWIIEDDFDSEFRYAGQPVPAMSALDHAGRCIYVGTFSKTFSHALRLGYLILPTGLIDRFRAALRHASSGAAVTAQRPLAEFLKSGQYDRHIRRARRLYALRYAAIADTLETWPHESGHFHRHEAGMQIAYLLRPGQNDTPIVAAARAAGFSIRGISDCDPTGQTHGLLIGFCQSQPEAIPTQLDTLRQVIQGCQKI